MGKRKRSLTKKPVVKQPQNKKAKDFATLKRRFKTLTDESEVEDLLKDWEIQDLTTALSARQLSLVETVEMTAKVPIVHAVLQYTKSKVSLETVCKLARAFVEVAETKTKAEDLQETTSKYEKYMNDYIESINNNPDHYKVLFEKTNKQYPVESMDIMIEIIINTGKLEFVKKLNEIYDIKSHVQFFFNNKQKIKGTEEFIIPPIWLFAIQTNQQSIFEYLISEDYVKELINNLSESDKLNLYEKLFLEVIRYFRRRVTIELLAKIFDVPIIPADWDSVKKIHILLTTIQYFYTDVQYQQEANKPTKIIITFEQFHFFWSNKNHKEFLEIIEYLITELKCPVNLNKTLIKQPSDKQTINRNDCLKFSLLDEALQRYDGELAELLIKYGCNFYSDFFEEQNEKKIRTPWENYWTRNVPNLLSSARDYSKLEKFNLPFIDIIKNEIENFTVLTEIPCVSYFSSAETLAITWLHPLQVAYNSATYSGIPSYMNDILQIISNSEDEIKIDKVYGGLNKSEVNPLSYYYLRNNLQIKYFDEPSLQPSIFPFSYYIVKLFQPSMKLKKLKEDVKKKKVDLQGALRSFYAQINEYYQRTDIHEYLLKQCKDQINEIGKLPCNTIEHGFSRDICSFPIADPRYDGLIGSQVGFLLLNCSPKDGWKFKREILYQLLEAGADANYPIIEKNNNLEIKEFNFFDYFVDNTLLNDQAEVFQVLLDHGAFFLKKTTSDFCQMNNVYPPKGADRYLASRPAPSPRKPRRSANSTKEKSEEKSEKSKSDKMSEIEISGKSRSSPSGKEKKTAENNEDTSKDADASEAAKQIESKKSEKAETSEKKGKAGKKKIEKEKSESSSSDKSESEKEKNVKTKNSKGKGKGKEVKGKKITKEKSKEEKSKEEKSKEKEGNSKKNKKEKSEEIKEKKGRGKKKVEESESESASEEEKKPKKGQNKKSSVGNNGDSKSETSEKEYKKPKTVAKKSTPVPKKKQTATKKNESNKKRR